MTRALIYKPAPRWPIAVALALAALIHVAAIAFATRTMPELPPATGNDEIEVVVSNDPTPVLPPATADDPPLPASPVDLAEPLFVEPASPPPLRKASAQPLVRRTPPQAGVASATTTSAARVLALSAPHPEYPYEARRAHLTGSGVATLSIDFTTGTVRDARMTQSTGSAALDNATLAAFRRWRFKPATVSSVRAPITFTLAGASY